MIGSPSRKQLVARIRRRERITGNDAIRASKLGLGEIKRSCSGELCLAPFGFRGGLYRKYERLE